MDLVFRWARKSGFVKVRRGRVEPTRRAVRLARDPLAAWERAFAGLLDVGIIQHHYRHLRCPLAGAAVGGRPRRAVEALLALLHAAREAQPELVALAREVVEAAWKVDELPPEDYEQWRGAAARDVKAALALFVELGALEALEPGAASGPGGLAGGVTLTDLGQRGVHERAREAGIDVPVAGALREASAGELLAALADQPDLVARSEALAWLGERQPAAAARDVVAALRAATPSLDEVGVGLAMLSEIGDDAVPAMRALAEDDQLGAFAGGWLVERGLAAPLVEPAAVVLGVAAVADAETAADAFLELPVAVQRQVIDDLRHQGGPQAEEVLAAVAATHPDKAVAKAARRARFRLARGQGVAALDRWSTFRRAPAPARLPPRSATRTLGRQCGRAVALSCPTGPARLHVRPPTTRVLQMRTFSPRPTDIKPMWYVVDAQGEILGRLATRIAHVLRGKHKPTFAPHMDMGDFVIVVNAADVRLTGDKGAQSFAYRHSGYPGGLKAVPFARLLAEKPDRLVEQAVKGMLPKNTIGRAQLRKLKVYAGPEHPHAAQQPQPLPL